MSEEEQMSEEEKRFSNLLKANIKFRQASLGLLRKLITISETGSVLRKVPDSNGDCKVINLQTRKIEPD